MAIAPIRSRIGRLRIEDSSRHFSWFILGPKCKVKFTNRHLFVLMAKWARGSRLSDASSVSDLSKEFAACRHRPPGEALGIEAPQSLQGLGAVWKSTHSTPDRSLPLQRSPAELTLSKVRSENEM